jgi:membrane protein DedA with SNARE-associated domain
MLPFLPLPETQASLALSIVLFSFAYEDGATLLAAALTAAGRIDARLGLISAFLGIWIGDLGLYAAGATFGRRLVRSGWASRFVSPTKLDKAESWFAERGPATLVMSRFVPGSRLPLYLAAGTLRLSAKMFSVVTGICSAVWVTAIFVVWHFVPRPRIVSGRATPWLPAVAVLLGPWLLSRGAVQVGQRIRILFRKYRRWEFWPAWLFYPPVAAICAWLGLRYRGLSLPTIANPSFRNGGIIGESKIESLTALMATSPEFVADAYLIPAGSFADRKLALRKVCRERSITYPCVFKPNLGQRGDGFKLVSTQAEAERYLAKVQSDVVLQRYVSDEKEVGIFYYRFPGRQRGEIFAVTEKIFPAVVGDGERTFDELLYADARASLIARTYLDRFPELSSRVLPLGKRVRLVEAGNHCQGCIFRDGGHLVSEALRERIDQISRALPGFFVGRYDLRYVSDEDLRRGENFRIIELNGAASEATSIYDERNSLLSAYRTLYRQWELVFAIGRANRDLGHKSASALDVFRDWRLYRAISAAYPAAD